MAVLGVVLCIVSVSLVHGQEPSLLRPKGFVGGWTEGLAAKAGFVDLAGGVAQMAGDAAASAFGGAVPGVASVPGVGSVPGVQNLPGFNLAQPYFDLLEEQQGLLCEFPENLEISKGSGTPRYFGKMEFTKCDTEVSIVNFQNDVQPYPVQGGMKVEVCPGWKAWRTVEMRPSDQQRTMFCTGRKGCTGRGRKLGQSCNGKDCRVLQGGGSTSDEWEVEAAGVANFQMELCPEYTLTYGRDLLFSNPEICLDCVGARQYDLSCSWSEFKMYKKVSRHGGGPSRLLEDRDPKARFNSREDVCSGCPKAGRDKCNPVCKLAQDTLCEGVREKFKYMDADKFSDLQDVCSSRDSVW